MASHAGVQQRRLAEQVGAGVAGHAELRKDHDVAVGELVPSIRTISSALADGSATAVRIETQVTRANPYGFMDDSFRSTRWPRRCRDCRRLTGPEPSRVEQSIATAQSTISAASELHPSILSGPIMSNRFAASVLAAATLIAGGMIAGITPHGPERDGPGAAAVRQARHAA